MTWILGISAHFHDSACVLLKDGQVFAAASEERFSRVKHDSSFPNQAMAWCLRRAELEAEDIDYVGYYEKPLLKFERILETHLRQAPRSYRAFAAAIPGWINEKLHVRRLIHKHLGSSYRRRVVFTEHHRAHAASAFFHSPHSQAAVLVVDGVGEWSTTSIWRGSGNRLTPIKELHFPHSIGLLYSAFTQLCGFRVNSGEYKLMGLAPLGEPRFTGVLKEKVLRISDDGSFELDLDYFGFEYSLQMINRRLASLFGVLPRHPDEPIDQIHCDIAASVQQLTEEVMLSLASQAFSVTDESVLCLAGGVALNCVANSKLVANSPFDRIWVQPASGDAGGALGAAMSIHYEMLRNERHDLASQVPITTTGPVISRDESLQFFESSGVVWEEMHDQQMIQTVAKALDCGQVVAWVKGAAEFGPRALGHRSILADPRRADMKQRLNSLVKNREGFRPFAPAVLLEHAAEWFEIEEGEESPFMSFVYRVKSGGQLPAVTHADGTARVQTVDPTRYPYFHQLLEGFHAISGCPVLLNTSFNVRGEPLVNSACEAVRCFLATDVDVLVINDFLLRKTDQPVELVRQAQTYLENLVLD